LTKYFVALSLVFPSLSHLYAHRAAESFIRNKYERKKYLKKDGLPPNNPQKNSAPKETKPAEKVIN